METELSAREQDHLMTIAEVSVLIGVPIATLRYWRHRGTGPRSFRVGRHIKYWARDVQAWLRRQSDGGTGQPA
jgi:DNA-binding transcriptional MerR regulator